MSTRSTTHFYYTDPSNDPEAKPEAIVYRHHDGYPEGAGADLLKFIEQVKKECTGTSYGTRFNDPSYLSAKYLTFLVTEGYKYDRDTPLDFGGVGILSADPGDIEWRYVVVCDGDPTLYVQRIGWNEDDGPLEFVEDAINSRLAEQSKV